jgi:hypothetical protein
MGFTTPATREADIPIIVTEPLKLPSTTPIPWDPYKIVTPAREPETVPAKRGAWRNG